MPDNELVVKVPAQPREVASRRFFEGPDPSWMILGHSCASP